MIKKKSRGRMTIRIERKTSGLVEACENTTLGSNNVFLTASLVARLSLGVSSD